MMQLATSSRPHPPPVPPRPSRQVVAEALKRSTRLPCPTRQAPPPPNTRPWRSEDHVSEARECRDGRTLVYESATLGKDSPSNCEDSVRSASEPREETSRREPKSPRRSGSYGYVDRDSRGEKSVVEDCKPIERCEAPNYQNRLARESPEKMLPISRTNGKTPDDRDRDEESPISTIKNTGDSTKADTDYRRSKDGACLDGRVIENVLEHREKSEDKPRATVAKENRSALAKHSDSHKTSPLTPGISTTPTRIMSILNVTNDENCQPTTTTDDTSLCAEGNKDGDKTYNGAGTTTISSDDCTTVVVIDEPQRKISFNEDNIQHQDWLEAGVRYSSTKITLPYGEETYDRTDEQSTLDGHQDHHEDYHHRDPEDRNDLPVYSERDFASIRERIAMSSLQGLPPLPRSLSGFNLNEGRREACEPPPPPTRSSSKTPKNVKSTQPSSSRPSPPGRQLTTLDTQLAILRKEMFGLRQLDLSLLSQLWSLNESIQEFRQLLQEQEDRAPSPSPSSEEGDDTSYGSHPPPPPRRPAPLLHHHRPPRPPRPLRPPASDESPSSEEYGAV